MDKSASWDDLKRLIKPGYILEGTVIQHKMHGLFVDLGYAFEGYIPLIEVREPFSEEIEAIGRLPREERPKAILASLPPIGSRVTGIVQGLRDHEKQIQLSLKPSEFDRLKLK